MTYRVLRGISIKQGGGWRDWQAGDVLSEKDAPAKAIKDWLSVGAIEEEKTDG